MPEPLVKVVVTSYNRPQWLREAVASVLAQTYEELHVVIVDDASNPETIAEITRIAAENPDRVTAIVKTDNRGVADSIRAGIRAAPEAPYIALLNDDDRWYPRKLELQIPLLESATGPALVYCDADVYREEEGTFAPRSYMESTRPLEEDDLLDWVRSDRAPPPSLVINRELAELALESMPAQCRGWDYFLLLLARAHGPLLRVDERLAVWRTSASGQHRDQAGVLRELLTMRVELFRKHPEFVSRARGRRALRRELAILAATWAQRRLRLGDLGTWAWCAAMVLRQRDPRSVASLIVRSPASLWQARSAFALRSRAAGTRSSRAREAAADLRAQPTHGPGTPAPNEPR